MLNRVKNKIKRHFLPYDQSKLAENQRITLSTRYLTGAGLEIGALHNPLPLPNNAVAEYVDKCSRQENIEKYPELAPTSIVNTDYIDDGFLLSTVPKSSQDFLIANHVLEHAPNPLQVIKNWARIIKPEGVLFITLPLAEGCFDQGRQLTPLEYFIDDFVYYEKQAQPIIDQRNQEHLFEWIIISEKNALEERGATYTPPSWIELKQRIKHTNLDEMDIHFHTFSVGSLADLLRYFTKEVETDFGIEVIEINGPEIVAVLKKTVQSERHIA